MPAVKNVRARIAMAAAALRLTIAAAGLTGMLASFAAQAQDAPAAPRAGAPREASRWDLPRIFYDPRQRRTLDAQERAIRLGLEADGDGPTGPRFDGWLAGPAGTHAWVSGTRYVADRTGRLHAAQENPGQGADAMEDGAAQLDRTRGVLVVHRDTEGTLHLRVGEADNPLDPAAPAPAATATR